MNGFFDWQNLIFCIALLIGIALVVGAAFGLHVDSFDGGVSAGDGTEALAEPHAVGAQVPDGSVDSVSLLALLGIGKAPLSVFLITLLFTFGGVGLCLNALLASWLKAPVIYVLVSVIAFLVARSAAKFVGRHIPSIESYATEKTDVVGATGVAETAIGTDFGIALVTDDSGSLLQLKCRAHRASIGKGREVLVVDYEPASDFYIVDEYTAEPLAVRAETKGGL